jgi:hypothetical protein
LSESYDLRPTYSFTAAALDRGHQSFEQSDWPSRSRDGISLYIYCGLEVGFSFVRIYRTMLEKTISMIEVLMQDLVYKICIVVDIILISFVNMLLIKIFYFCSYNRKHLLDTRTSIFLSLLA